MQADHSPGYEFTSRMAVHHWPVVPLFGLLDAALPESPGLDCGAHSVAVSGIAALRSVLTRFSPSGPGVTPLMVSR
jgi:hypothetical protein